MIAGFSASALCFSACLCRSFHVSNDREEELTGLAVCSNDGMCAWGSRFFDRGVHITKGSFVTLNYEELDLRLISRLPCHQVK